jgi:hypothetical protein
MTKTVKLILLLSALFAAASPGLFSAGFSLVDKDDTKLTLNTSLAFLLGYGFGDDGLDGSVENASVTFNAKLQKIFEFKLAFDAAVPEDVSQTLYLAMIKDAYGQLTFSDYIRIRLGRFKAPFGEEVLKGLDERPYAERTRTSKTIPPGRALGIMFSGKKILDLFGYEIGAFTGTELEVPDGAQNELCAAGKVFLRFNTPDLLDIKLGYNAFYHYYEYTAPNHGLAQGFFLSAEILPDKDQKLTLSAEYQERMKIRTVSNPTPDWARGIIGYLAYRIFMVEPFALFELYDGSLQSNDKDDLLCLTTGMAAYFLKKDLIQVKANYHLEYGVYTGLLNHRLSMIVQMEY